MTIIRIKPITKKGHPELTHADSLSFLRGSLVGCIVDWSVHFIADGTILLQSNHPLQTKKNEWGAVFRKWKADQTFEVLDKREEDSNDEFEED